MRTYILPDGTITKDVNLYADTWCKLADKVCTLVPNSTHIGLNTGTIIIHTGGMDCELPVSFALAIEKLVDNKIQG